MLRWMMPWYHATAAGLVKSTVPNVKLADPLAWMYALPALFCAIQ